MNTVNEYIASKPGNVQMRMEELRSILRDCLPGSTESLKWGEPAFLHESGMILVIIGAYKQHCNVVVTPSAMNAMRDKVADFETGKGSVKIPHDTAVPRELIRELASRRLREYEEEGVKWM